MKLEEAIAKAKILNDSLKELTDEYEGQGSFIAAGMAVSFKLVLDTILTALRPVSREQVEKVWGGEWRDLHGDKLVGIDDVGQDVYRHYHYSVCKKCGKGIAVKSNFCPYCGDAKTDKAVQMVMERWEALTNVKTD